MRAFWHIQSTRFENGILLVQVAELVNGKPDGAVGLPLVISRKSRVFELAFSGVGGFLAVPEPESNVSASAEHLAPCVWVERDSWYARKFAEISDWCAFGRHAGNEGALVHYVVPGENFFLNILAGSPPRVASLSILKRWQRKAASICNFGNP